MRDRNVIAAPKVVTVSFGLEPAFSASTTLMDILYTQKFPGMDAWLQDAEHIMSQEMLHNHRIIYDALCYHTRDVLPAQKWSSFLDYVDTLEQIDPVWYRNTMLEKLREYPLELGDGSFSEQPPDVETLLSDYDVYQRWHSIVWHDYTPNDEIDREAHALLNDPAELQRRFTSHMRAVWKEILSSDWQRNLDMLKQSIKAFQQLDYSNLTAYEAIRAVTGRDLSSIWPRRFDSLDRIIFIPSAHAGPYLTHFLDEPSNTLRLVFGARLPKGAKMVSPALSHSELLTRLTALADDMRLRILELLVEHDELCAQDIMTRLDLSQPTASRHLRQLTANGYITERRRELNKCYSLNHERVEDTMRAIERMFKPKE